MFYEAIRAFKAQLLTNEGILSLLGALDRLSLSEQSQWLEITYSEIRSHLLTYNIQANLLNWKDAFYSYLNIEINKLRLEQSNRVIKKKLLTIRRSIALINSFDEISAYLENIIHDQDIFDYSSLIKNCVHFSKITYFPIKISSKNSYKVIPEYVDHLSAIYFSDRYESKRLVADACSFLNSIGVANHIFTNEKSGNPLLWLRDPFVAFIKNQEPGYLQWENPRERKKVDEIALSLMLRKENNYLSFDESSFIRTKYKAKKLPSLSENMQINRIENRELLLQGGNIMVLLREDNSKVVLIGESSIAQIMANKMINTSDIPQNTEIEFNAEKLKNFRREIKMQIANYLGLENNDDLCVIPEADYHLDLYLFSPKPGVVILNTISQADLLLNQEDMRSIHRDNIQLTKDYVNSVGEKIENIYHTIFRKLSNKGIKVIRSPLSLGRYIIKEKSVIPALFNFANGLTVKDVSGQYHFLTAKSFFPSAEKILSSTLDQIGVEAHFLGDARENAKLHELYGSLRCLSLVLPRLA